MVGAFVSPEPTNQAIDCLFAALDPKSLIHSQFGGDQKPNFLELTTESLFMERGPRYKAYAQLRESKLRMKMMRLEQEQKSQDSEINLSPPKKQVKFQGNFPAYPARRRGPSSALAQSVPDFSAALRKENRKPTNTLPPMVEKSATPPAKSSKLYGVGSRSSGGSKSASSLEKRAGGILARKSYATMEELKGLSTAAANAIGRESRGGGRSGRGGGIARAILGNRR